MPVRRGVVYEYSGASGVAGLLVLTNDDWNDNMEEVGIVPVREPVAEASPELYPVVSETPPLQAIAGRLLSVDKTELGRPLVVLDNQQLAAVEDVLCDILALGSLCRREPKRPPLPKGVVDYPLWGEIYYAGEPILTARRVLAQRQSASSFREAGPARAWCGRTWLFAPVYRSVRGVAPIVPRR